MLVVENRREQTHECKLTGSVDSIYPLPEIIPSLPLGSGAAKGQSQVELMRGPHTHTHTQQKDTESSRAISELSAEKMTLLQEVARLQSKERSTSNESAAENRALSREIEELRAELKEQELSRTKNTADLADENKALKRQVVELEAQMTVHDAAKREYERREGLQRHEAVKNKTQLEVLKLETSDLRRCAWRHGSRA